MTNGETYQIYFRGQLTAYIGGALKFTIIRLNGAGTADDDTTVSSATWNTVVGGVNLNNWQTVDISFTADASDASSTNGLQLNMFKNYGDAYKIDDFRVTCTSCPHTSYQNGNWSSTSTWGGNGVPPSSENTVVKHDVTVDASTNNLGNLTVNSGKTLTINSLSLIHI